MVGPLVTVALTMVVDFVVSSLFIGVERVWGVGGAIVRVFLGFGSLVCSYFCR